MGMSYKPGLFDDAEVLHTYSRAQAIADGSLVDLRQVDLASIEEIGFKFPIACTVEVFSSCIDLTDAAKRAGNDLRGRLWDVLWMLKLAINSTRGQDRVTFTVRVVRDRVRPTPTTLVAVCGPGDDGDPVVTLMFPNQD